CAADVIRRAADVPARWFRRRDLRPRARSSRRAFTDPSPGAFGLRARRGLPVTQAGSARSFAMRLREIIGRGTARARVVPRRQRRLDIERLEDRAVPSTRVEQGPGPIVGGLVEGLSTVTGAVEAIATDPHNADVVFVGAVNGGVWKTTNATAA